MNQKKETFCLLYIIKSTSLSLYLTVNCIYSTHVRPPSLLLSSQLPLHLQAHRVNSDDSLHANISDSRGHTVLLLLQYTKQAQSQADSIHQAEHV